MTPTAEHDADDIREVDEHERWLIENLPPHHAAIKPQ
jgi:hypothetical protein